jgi:hypothetical protein
MAQVMREQRRGLPALPAADLGLPAARPGRVWPTREQALLLRAALGDGDEAQVAWEAWRAATDFDRLDGGSYRLLPLLYRNLERLGVGEEGTDLGRLRGIYRRTWYKNRIAIAHLAGLIGHLDAAGIPTMVLKGAALTTLYYRDHGGRAMEDCDLLVPVARAREAVAVAVTRRGCSRRRSRWASPARPARRSISTGTRSGRFARPTPMGRCGSGHSRRRSGGRRRWCRPRPICCCMCACTGRAGPRCRPSAGWPTRW